MPAKSELGNPRGLWRVPRWTLEVWLWGAVLASVLESLGCPDGRLFETCVSLGNTAVLPFEVFPESVALLLIFAKVPAPVVWACVIACGVVCHWLMRRFLPARLSLLVAGLLLVSAFALNMAVDFLAFWNLFSHWNQAK